MHRSNWSLEDGFQQLMSGFFHCNKNGPTVRLGQPCWQGYFVTTILLRLEATCRAGPGAAVHVAKVAGCETQLRERGYAAFVFFLRGDRARLICPKSVRSVT